MYGSWTRHGVWLLLLQAALLMGCERGATPVAPDAPAAIENSGGEAAVAPRPTGPERIVVAFGDSLYAGYGLGAGEGLPDRLQAELREGGVNATVIRAGVSGDTTAAGLQRLAFTLDSLPRTPDLVLLGLGGNDALRQIAPGETRANMDAMLAELKRRGIAVVLTGMIAPPNLGEDYARDFNRIWPELAVRYAAPLDPFILAGVVGDPAMMLGDGIHPSARGVEHIAERVAPLVADRLSAIPPR